MNTEKKITAAQRRTRYARTIEHSVRSFGSYLSQVKADADAVQLTALKAEADEAAKAAKAAKAALKEAEAAAKADADNTAKADAAKAAKAALQHADQIAANFAQRIADAGFIIDKMPARFKIAQESLADVTLDRSEININFLRQWLPEAVNSRNEICDCKKVALEDEQAAIAAEPETGFEHKDADGILIELRPVRLWTASKLLNKFAKAAKARDRAAHQASQIEREQQRAEREKQRYLANLRKVKEYESKHQPQPEEQSK